MNSNTRLATATVCGAGAFVVLSGMGYNGSTPAGIPGLPLSISAEVVKYVLTIAIAIIPAYADKILPGLGALVRGILESLRPKGGAADKTVPAANREAEFTDALGHISALTSYLSGDEAGQTAAQSLTKNVTDAYMRAPVHAPKPG